MKLDRKTRVRIHQAVRTIEPYAKAAERAAMLYLTARRGGVVAVMGVASTVFNVAREHQLKNSSVQNPLFRVPLPMEQIAGALDEAGARARYNAETKEIHVRDGAWEYSIDADGDITVHSGERYQLIPRLAAMFNRFLPPAITIATAPSSTGKARWSMGRVDTPVFPSREADEIAACTIPMLEDGKKRCLLLYGEPGVGKTTMAHVIAAKVGGRLVVLGSGVFAPRGEDDGQGKHAIHTIAEWEMLSASVIVVDDVDKLVISLGEIEFLRSRCRLLILTANNADRDDVLDGSFMRPGRVEETWRITSDAPARPPSPFDQVDPEIWAMVRSWPIAYQVELAFRIEKRGPVVERLRIPDLQDRLRLRTRSGGHLFGGAEQHVPPPPPGKYDRD